MSGQLTLDWAPLVPWPLLAALGALAFVLVGLALGLRAPGAGWRLLAVGGLLLALANPSLLEEEREALSDVAILLVDRSPSQKIGERAAQTDAAVAHVLERLERLPETEVRVIETGGDALAQEGGNMSATPS